MAKKGNDINLFKAASKSDKKIQTGVSKSFLGVLAIILILAVVGGYVGSLLMDVQELNAEILVLEGYANYGSSINVLTNQIVDDQAVLAGIQADIDAATAIKQYALSTSILFPGLTTNQQNIIFGKTYLDQGVEKDGCVPAEIASKITAIFTDGIMAFPVTTQNDQMEYSVQNKIFEKGYMIIQFQGAEGTLDSYVANIVSKANTIFASEDGDVVDINSFEKGIVSAPTAEAPTIFTYYIKCKLKSVFQIVSEDEYINTYLISMPNLSFTGKALTIDLTTRVVPLRIIADYLYRTGLFTYIDYSGEIMTVDDEDVLLYSGKLICSLKEID